jgi:anti-anti-sigma factor
VRVGNLATEEVVSIDSLHGRRDGAGTASLRTLGGKAFLAGSDQGSLAMRNFIGDLYPVEWAGGQAVVTLPEHIGISNAGQIRDVLLSVINRGATTLIADLTATVSCDQSGAEAVFRAWQRAAANGTELRLVITAQIVARMLRLVGLNRTVSVYPSLDAATAARLPTAAGVPAESVPGRGSGDMTAAQQAHLRTLDAVITGLFQVELGLQTALDLPADPARKRTGEALDDLTGVIGEIRAIVSAAHGQAA